MRCKLCIALPYAVCIAGMWCDAICPCSVSEVPLRPVQKFWNLPSLYTFTLCRDRIARQDPGGCRVVQPVTTPVSHTITALQLSKWGGPILQIVWFLVKDDSGIWEESFIEPHNVTLSFNGSEWFRWVALSKTWKDYRAFASCSILFNFWTDLGIIASFFCLF